MSVSDVDEGSITDLNITPLVDVILVLLIIFMATAPLINRRSINVNVPKAANAEPKATATLNLIMNDKREILLADQHVRKEDLEFQLKAIVRADPAVHIAILADQSIPYGEVVELLDMARGAGVKKVAMEVRAKKIQ